MRVNDVRLAGGGIFLPKLFQTAYVTTTLKKAQDLLEARYGITAWHEMRNSETREGTHVTLANARVGDMVIEIIEVGEIGPGGGTVWHDLPLSPDDVMRFHHFGHIYYDAGEWEHINAEIASRGLKIAEKDSFGDMLDYIFVDERDLLGHWVEFVYCKPAGRAFFDSFPAN